LLRPEAVKALRGAEVIIHAGDVGDPAILEELRTIAPVYAVRGNIDTGEWASQLPLSSTVNTAGTTIHVLHDVKELKGTAPKCDIVVSGHSHKPGQEERGGVLYINPGSAGPRRFRLPITVARLHLEGSQRRVEFVELAVRR
jgi:putative phosphoesterase